MWPKPQARTGPGVDQFHCTTNQLCRRNSALEHPFPKPGVGGSSPPESAERMAFHRPESLVTVGVSAILVAFVVSQLFATSGISLRPLADFPRTPRGL